MVKIAFRKNTIISYKYSTGTLFILDCSVLATSDLIFEKVWMIKNVSVALNLQVTANMT
jgi:hypothetical protein